MTVSPPAIGSSASSIVASAELITDVVLAAAANTPDPRLRRIVESLVRHLHAFARDVALTEDEYHAGVDALNRIGAATNDAHNEGMLVADVLGLSTLVCLLNNGDTGATETAAALLGPFWRMASPPTANGASIVRSETPGAPLFVTGRIVDPSGVPIAGVTVDIWQASPVGLYENQDPQQAEMNLRGQFTTDADGGFRFRSVKPAGYPVPTDGPAGDLLRAQRRHPFRPAHLHVLGYRPGFRTLITQVFVDDDPYLDSDAVFGVTPALIGAYTAHDGDAPEPDVTGRWFGLHYTFTMSPGEAKLPVPPIK